MLYFENSVNKLFSFLKNTKDIKSSWINSISIPNGHFLLPVTKATSDDAEAVEKLTKWRNEFSYVYPSQFIATKTSTINWLDNILIPSETRVLFFIIDKASNIVGHVGLNAEFNDNENVLEIDNVIKSSQCNTTKLMSDAIHALIKWATNVLPVDSIKLKVMSDNKHAVDFYKQNNFVIEKELKLRRETFEDDASRINFVLDSHGTDGSMLLMTYQFPNVDEDQMILTAGPSISQMEGYYAYDAAMRGWNSNWSKYLKSFEAEFSEYVGSKYAIPTSSCTGALQISLMACGIGEGDEVIVPDETWVASATAVRDVGATPIFCDVDIDTYNIDVNDCAHQINSKTKAIIPVHMYGNPANIVEIMNLANQHGLRVIEDAAPSIGAKVDGKCVGTFGDFGCFSFQGAKMLVTGEGGMLVTDDYELYLKALKISDQGRNPDLTFWIDDRGVKYKMSNVQAAIGLAQIQRSDLQIAMKRRINKWYKEYLSNIDCIEFQGEYENAESINWMTSIRLLDNAPITRDELITQLRIKNVDTRPLFPAISQYPIWDKTQSAARNAYILGQTALNLPSGVGLSQKQIEFVCQKIKSCLDKPGANRYET